MNRKDHNTVVSRKAATVDGTVEIEETSWYVPLDSPSVVRQSLLNELVVKKNQQKVLISKDL